MAATVQPELEVNAGVNKGFRPIWHFQITFDSRSKSLWTEIMVVPEEPTPLDDRSWP